jgi:bifunctional DNA-binding transcriptional regulator/antitoxin component of YhaV-PrlF toxin-antitoxin module
VAGKENSIRSFFAVVREKIDGGSRAMVPAEVRDGLGARPGDKIVFEAGSERAVFLAALKGDYFVVTIERRKDEPALHEQQIKSENSSASVESLAETVKRKLSGEGK